jgi:replicative DNA helicase
MGDEVIAAYLKIKEGERGILTPWDSINDATLGFVGGDFVVLVARMGVGKTWAMLMLAMRAWMDGKKVLFVATEMARMKLAIRFFCLYLKLPYYEVTHGKLDAFREGELMTAVKDLAKQRGIQIMGDNFDAKIEEIYAAIEHDKPDVLFVDGMYLIKNKGANRHERVSNTADDLKRLAKQKNIPVVCSSQFNREVDPNNMQAVDATNVGITDVIGWNADVMYALYRTTDMEADNIMGWKPLKLREGSGKGFATNWNFRDMNFEQITAAGGFSDRDTYNGGSGSVDNGGSKIADDTDGFVF